jgi:hypothetical protein
VDAGAATVMTKRRGDGLVGFNRDASRQAARSVGSVQAAGRRAHRRLGREYERTMAEKIEVPQITSKSTAIEKGLAVAAVLAAITVPVATTLIASGYSQQSAQREGNVKLVELAVGILREPPNPASQDIRAWAIEVLNAYSGVKLNQNASNQLIKSLPLPGGPPVVVPDFLGLSPDRVRALAASLGLQVEINGPPVGMVHVQSPAPGTRVSTGSVVTITFESLPPPESTPRQGNGKSSSSGRS